MEEARVIMMLTGALAQLAPEDALRPVLEALLREHRKQDAQLRKLTRISDRYQKQLKEANLALAQASFTDLLTGLPNRRAMVERVNGELGRSDRNHASPALLMVDVDHFKQVNDSYGHETGDQVLQSLANTLRSTVRAYDTCARWGGEEFLVLLPETAMADAVGVGEKLRRAAQQRPEGEPLPGITLSIGVAVHRQGETPAAVLRRADDAKYEAKRQGRNRVVAAE
jgi:diguanylate cyclase (GGDEF)-like protein